MVAARIAPIRYNDFFRAGSILSAPRSRTDSAGLKGELMHGFLIGLQFLTQLPIRTKRSTPDHIADSYYFYPVIGFLIGAGAILVRRILMIVFPLSFSIAIVLAF